MWGLAGWTGNDDEANFESLSLAADRGVNFFDTAWAYGNGKSEQILGRLLRAFPDKALFSATKIPPKNRKWPALSQYEIRDIFPPEYIREYTLKSLENLGISCLPLQQFHVWNDRWAQDDSWKKEVEALKKEGLVRSFGISVNRFEPENVLRTLETGLIDSVQVVYNLFDQNPEERLFPYCQEKGIAIIARVPFDEGSLTGTLSMDTQFPEEDWRSLYFNSANLRATLPRVELVREDLPPGMAMAELALRFILQHPAVTTVIPGMRKKQHVEGNVRCGDGVRLSPELYTRLRRHRWDRSPRQNPTP